MRSQLLVVGLNPWSKGIQLKKCFCSLMSCRVVPIYSFYSFNVSDFTLRCLLHLDIIFMQDNRCKTNFVFLHVDTQFSQNQLLKMLSFLQCLFLALLSLSGGCSYNLVLYLLFCLLIYVSILCQCMLLFSCYSSIIYLEIYSSKAFSNFSICFFFSAYLWLPRTFSVLVQILEWFLYFCKNAVGILVVTALNIKIVVSRWSFSKY